MSAPESQPMSAKELKETFELFGKDALVGFVVEKTLEIRILRREIEELKTELE